MAMGNTTLFKKSTLFARRVNESLGWEILCHPPKNLTHCEGLRERAKFGGFIWTFLVEILAV